MAENKFITEKQTAELVGKTIKNLEIDIDLSEYQKAEDSETLRSELEEKISKKVDTETFSSKVGELESSIEDKADQSSLEELSTDLTNKLSTVYRYKGSKTLFDELPKEGNEIGDVWDVNNGMNYAWTGSAWDALGDTRIEVDAILSDTSTNPVQNKVIKEEIDKVKTAQSNFVSKTDLASDSDDGLMSSTDFTKLKGIEPNANHYELPESPVGAKALNLYKVETNKNGMVVSTKEVTKQDIVDLGITDTTYSAITSAEIDTLFD